MSSELSKINSRASLDRSPKKNWVENSGGLPMYIRRIANHLHQEKGMTIGHAIAVAVNAVKKMCASGDLNFRGRQNVNAGSRAEACAAVASWEKKKAGARVSKGILGRKWSDDEFIDFILFETDTVQKNHIHKGEGECHVCEIKAKRKRARNKKKKVSKKREQPAGYVKETKEINERKKDHEGKHKFKAAKWTHPNGHPRCSLCGDEEPPGGICKRQRPREINGKFTKVPGGKLRLDDDEFEKLAQEIDAEFNADVSFDATGEIEKRDDEKRLVFGWASIAKHADGTVEVDKQGDVLEDIDQMEKVAYDFVLHSRDGGEMHVRKGVSTMVESFVSTQEKWDAMGIPEGVLPTGWWVGFKVNDSEVWKGVKEGKYKMFSVHGSGTRKALD